jgi:hypothetical protein
MKIYIAGPYSSHDHAAVDTNVTAAIDAGIAVLKRGHVPFIPHLSHFVDLRATASGQPIGYEDYMA